MIAIAESQHLPGQLGASYSVEEGKVSATNIPWKNRSYHGTFPVSRVYIIYINMTKQNHQFHQVRSKKF